MKTYVKNLNIFDLCSIKLGICVTGKNSVNLLVGQFTSALDNTLADPGLIIKYNTGMGVDFEYHTDSESIFARHQRAKI